jgi:pimeloyl-ACP methyl ester carboxylesterase
MPSTVWPMRRPRRFRPVLVVACAALVATGCGSDSGNEGDVRSTATDVPFTGCDKIDCTGEIDGVPYEIRLPANWNGTLLLYSHGYRPAQAVPPVFDTVETDPQVAATDEVATLLIGKGYALAGSAFASNGWAVADGIAAGEQLREFFADNVARPARTYVWGDSLGGLITQELAERHPEWISGAAPMCGVLGGANLNFDLALDASYAIKTLLAQDLKITDYASHDEAVAAFRSGYDRLLAATEDLTNDVPKLLVAAAVVDPARKTARFDGSTPESQVSAVVEGLVTALAFSTIGRYEIEQRVGGNPSDNSDADYPARVSDEERSLIEAVSPGSTDRVLAQLAAGQTVAADPDARAEFDTLGNPTGDVKVPTIALHTAADPLVLVQNESVFADRVAGSEDRTADVVQLYTVPPDTYDDPAPYGAGHCNFTTEERVGTIDVLNRWVRDGVYPVPAAAAAEFGTNSGIEPTYRPAPWPAPEALD